MKKLVKIALIPMLILSWFVFGGYIVTGVTKIGPNVREYTQPQLFMGRLSYALHPDGTASINYTKTVFSRNIMVCTNKRGRITDIFWDAFLLWHGKGLWILPRDFKDYPWLVAQAKIALEKGTTLKSKLPAPTREFLANQKLARQEEIENKKFWASLKHNADIQAPEGCIINRKVIRWKRMKVGE